MQGTTIRFDRAIVEVIQRLPEWLTPIMAAATFVGLPAVICALAALISVISWVKGKHQIAYSMIASVVALGGNSVLKHVIHRARPDTMYVQHMRIHSYSFPSGHAFGAAVFYGLLAYLGYKYLDAPWNAVVLVALICLIVLIGISRVFLGAHFPSDVIVGWLLGSASLVVIIKVLHP